MLKTNSHKIEEAESAAILSLDKLSRSFNERPILRSLEYSFKEGITLVLGANGSGKSTLLKVIAHILSPSAGQVLFKGMPLAHSDARSKALSRSYLGHDSQLYSQLSVQENLDLRAKILGTTLPSTYLQEWNLERYAKVPALELSKGTLQRAALAATFLQTCSCILLDEPSANLDDASTELLVTRLQNKRAAGCCTLIATHDLTRLQGCATACLVLKDGEIISNPTSSISESIGIYRENNR